MLEAAAGSFGFLPDIPGKSQAQRKHDGPTHRGIFHRDARKHHSSAEHGKNEEQDKSFHNTGL